MNLICLTNVGDLDWDWLWSTKSIQDELPFNSFMSFKFFDIVRKITINADSIVEMKEGYPRIMYKKEFYVKRCGFVEWLFGKKYDYDYECKLSDDKLTWVKLSTGSSFYVSESIEEIENMANS